MTSEFVQGAVKHLRQALSSRFARRCLGVRDERAAYANACTAAGDAGVVLHPRVPGVGRVGAGANVRGLSVALGAFVC